MHVDSLATLTQDLAALVAVGRSDMDMLTVTAQQTSCGLIIMVRDGALQLIYPQGSWLDLRIARFWSFALRNRLSPRFEDWGKEKIHRLNLGKDPVSAAELVDRSFRAVYGMVGPFALRFRRQGWGPAARAV
jgi:hypothetical protein